MSKINYFLIVFLFALSACTKEIGNTNTNLAVSTQPIPVPANAFGQLTAVNNSVYTHTGTPPDSLIMREALTLFKDTAYIYGGVVTAGNDTLVYDTAYAYNGYLSDKYFQTFSSNVTWSVSGNSGRGLNGFTYTDNTPFPTISGLKIPATIQAAKGLTLNYTISGAYDFFYFQLTGSVTGLPLSANSNTTASFSTDQINAAAATGQLIVRAQIGKVTPYTIGGKTFYFVKTTQVDLYTTVK